MKLNLLIVFIVLNWQWSCEHWKAVEQDNLVARVGTHYLYTSDLEGLLPPNITPSDSILLVQNIINTWAKKQLLYDQSLLNLDQPTLQSLEQLVDNYRLDLFAQTYKESLVNETATVSISTEVLEEYYNNNQSIFKLDEPAVKARYIVMPKEIIDRDLIQQKFLQNTPEDKAFLDSLRFQFVTFKNDAPQWLTQREFHKIFPVIPNKQLKNYLKKSQFFVLEDAIQVYLLWISDFRLFNENAPFPIVKNTIQKIVFNQNKLNYIKQFDQDILKDAIQTKKFEIYPKP